METKTRVIKGQYHDSVLLMQVAKKIKNIEGVADVAVVMGTKANKVLLKQAGMLTEDAQNASVDDLVICVKKEKDTELILEQIDTFFERKSSDQSGAYISERKTIRSAWKNDPDLNFAEISVAGVYAAREAREALSHGMHVLLFSDNVTLQDEIALKKFAISKGLLLMGPGAGTAIINGVGLGFANKVKTGPIGIVSAAGTGLQEVSTILDWAEIGISQAIGIGGRDLSEAVGGVMAQAGLEALIEDRATKVIILISKPADKTVTNKILQLLMQGKKPSVVCILGATFDKLKDKNIYFTRTLDECSLTAAALAGVDLEEYESMVSKDIRKLTDRAKKLKRVLKPEQKYIRGLYSGGTLCYEAQVIWNDMLKESVFSNAPLHKKRILKELVKINCHTALDLGEEEFTVGRPHPMIDNDLRKRYISSAGKEPSLAVIVLDVVIGYGAHADPGSELGEAIKQAKVEAGKQGREIHIIASVTGAKGDLQGLENTKVKLKEVGTIICDTNAQAARLTGLIIQK